MILDNVSKITQENDFNNKEIAKSILRYIFKNKKFNLSIVELATLSNVSQPSVSRFVKAVECKNYKEMCKKINMEIPSYFGDRSLYYSSNLYNLIDEIKFLEADEFDKEMILKAAQLIDKANKINISAIGGNQSLRVEIQHKLSQIGKNIMLTDDWHHQLMNLNYMDENDVLLILSYSGETNESIRIIEEAKEKKIKTISITGDFNSTIVKNVDVKLLIPSKEGKYRPFLFNGRILAFIIWEMVFEELLKQNDKYITSIEDWIWKNL